MDPGPTILAPSSAQGGCQSKPRPHDNNTPPAAAPSGARASPPRSPAPPPAAAPPGARAPRRRLQTGLGLPWLGSETSLLRSLRRPRRRAPSGPCRESPGSRPVPRGQPGGASMAWRRRRPEARGALALLALALCAPGARGRALEWFSAVVSTEYVDPQTNRSVRSVSESGRFGDSSPKEGARGLVGVPRAEDRDPEGCEAGTRFLVPGGRGAAPWVALVARGGCTFKEKVLAAARRNASAVVLYNEERHGNLTAPMSHAGKPPARGDGRGAAAVRRGPDRPRGPLPGPRGAAVVGSGRRDLRG